MNNLSLIIPTLNEQDYLPRLLDSIARQNYAGKLEVIVVDGGSADGTVKLAEQYQSKLNLHCFTTTPNVGHQRNFGVTHSHHAYLLFLDADVILPPRFLGKLSDAACGRSNFIAAVLHHSEQMTFVNVLALTTIYALFFLSWLGRTPVTNGDCILTTKDVHDRIGGFKEGAILGEDTDYGLRAVRAGAKYRFIWRTHIIASDRRMQDSGKFRLLLVWSKAFLRARKHGPTYQGVDYPFGHYKKPQ